MSFRFSVSANGVGEFIQSFHFSWCICIADDVGLILLLMGRGRHGTREAWDGRHETVDRVIVMEAGQVKQRRRDYPLKEISDVPY